MSSENQGAEQARMGPRSVSYRQPAQGASRWLIGCLAFSVGGIALVLLLGMVLVGGFVVMVFSGTELAGEAGPVASIHEVTLSGQKGAPKVAVIPVDGVLMPGASGAFGSDPRAVFEAMLKKARLDPDVRAVILSIDSGGGAITTCDIMYKDLQDFRDGTKKPVVVLMGDIAASGAYYLSCAADHVMAHPTTITGSIGVMMPLFSASDLLKKVGVTDQTITTGPYKDIASPWAAKSPEQWQKDKELLSGIMDQMYERFVDVVARGRGLRPDVVRKLADGRIYSSKEALADKLIDSIGYMSDAEAKVKELTGLSAIHVVEYGRAPSLAQMLFGATARR
jgi:protease-4